MNQASRFSGAGSRVSACSALLGLARLSTPAVALLATQTLMDEFHRDLVHQQHDKRILQSGMRTVDGQVRLVEAALLMSANQPTSF